MCGNCDEAEKRAQEFLDVTFGAMKSVDEDLPGDEYILKLIDVIDEAVGGLKENDVPSKAAGSKDPSDFVVKAVGPTKASRLYTLDEARSLIAKEECEALGHDYIQIPSFGGSIQKIYCGRGCGAEFKQI